MTQVLKHTMIPFVNDNNSPKSNSYTITYLHDDHTRNMIKQDYSQSRHMDQHPMYRSPSESPSWPPMYSNMFNAINSELQSRQYPPHDPSTLHTLMSFSQFPLPPNYHFPPQRSVDTQSIDQRVPQQNTSPQSPFNGSPNGQDRRSPTSASDSSSPDSSPRFSTPAQHDQAVIELPDPQMSMFYCMWSNCPEVFTTRSGLAAHVTIHIEVTNQIQCRWRSCKEHDTVFKNLRDIARHLAQADHIGQTFYIPKSMEALSKSKTKDKQFPCATCGRLFADASNCKKHQRVHDSHRERFHCSHEGCNKSYSTKTDLNIHTKTHLGNYPFKCKFPNCSKAFVRISELYAHERKHDNVTPHTCNYCGLQFKDKTKMKRHVTKEHENAFYGTL